MAILGGWCPDHSTLGRFLARLHDEASEAVFERLTVEALRALGKRVCDVSIDGTILPAVGSRYARLHADAVARHHEQATQALARAPEDATARERMQQAQACADTLAALQQTRREHGRDDASILICESEPEAITHKTKEGAFHPAYVASIVATPERFIVGLDIDSRDELVSVEPMLRTAMAISSKVDAALSATTATAGAEGGETREGERPASSRAAHTIEVARADGAYLKSKVLDLEAKLGIELRIQIGVLAASVLRPQGFDPDDPRAFDKDRFRLVVLPATAWRGARKCMQCPMGALLEHERNWPANKHIPAATSYRAHGFRCRSCPYASRCLQKAKERTVRRYVSDAAREAMRDRMLSPHARAEGSVRSKSVEPCFGSMKGPQGLRRFHRRGRRGARLEWCLHALAHNRRTPRIARERRTPRRPNGPSHAAEQPSSSFVGARGSSDAPSPTLRCVGTGVDRSMARFSRRSQCERAANPTGRAFCDSLVPSAYGAAWSRGTSVVIATRWIPQPPGRPPTRRCPQRRATRSSRCSPPTGGCGWGGSAQPVRCPRPCPPRGRFRL
jgi:hypothetical protein